MPPHFGRVGLAGFLCVSAAFRGATGQRPARGPGEIHGRLAESNTGQPIVTGSITVHRTGDTVAVAGTIPTADGVFRIQGLRPGRYSVRVRALGYRPLVRDSVVVSAAAPIADLGTIRLTEVPMQLGAQVVTAERDEVQLSPDKNVYSTRNMPSAASGTAIDVLRNVPSVEVDATNNVSLRGNTNVVVEINGRPSPLKGDQLGNFLAQLPASVVKHVEVSTNPSAKNDPDGTAGIINIVLDQEADIGWNGGFTTGTGTTGQVNASGNVGHQAGRLTLFLSYGLWRNHQEQIGSSEQQNLLIPVPSLVDSHLIGTSQPLFQNVTFRSDYRFTKADALSFDAMAGGGRFQGDNAAYYTDLDAGGDVIGLFDQYNNSVGSQFYQDYTLGYHHQTDAKHASLSTELRFTHGSNDGSNDLFGTLAMGSPATGAQLIPSERDVTLWAQPQYILQTDYTKPFGAGSKLETGFKEILRHTTTDFTAADLDSASGDFVVNPARTNDFDYREQIGAAYGVFTQQLGKWQTQAGVRLEEAGSTLLLPDAPADQQHVDNGYASLFPSALVLYNFTPTRSLKLSYSRRISRPMPFEIDPVVEKQDARDYFAGNPNLRPEYTDAVELGYQETRGWGTIQINPYLRNTAHAVRYIQTVDTTGITYSTFDNVASTMQAGTDLNVTYRKEPLTLFAGGNAWYYTSNASNLPGNFSVRTTVWSARANATWSLTKTLDVQSFANYRSPLGTEGGSRSAFVYMNFALRKTLWNNKGSVTLRVQDPFNMMAFGSVVENPAVIQTSLQNFGQRGVFIAIQRNFGQDIKLRPRSPDEQPGPQGPPSGVP